MESRGRRRKSGDGPGSGSKSRKIADFMQPSQLSEVEKATKTFTQWLFGSQYFVEENFTFLQWTFRSAVVAIEFILLFEVEFDVSKAGSDSHVWQHPQVF